MPEWFEKVTIGNLLDRLAQRCGERKHWPLQGSGGAFSNSRLIVTEQHGG